MKLDLSKFTPIGQARTVLVVLGVIVSLALAGVVVYRLFFQGQDLARETGNRIVAEQQIEAEANIAQGAMDAVHEREVYREHVTEVVRESSKEIDNAWNGETVGVGVDAAGAAALCSLHHSLCRPAPAAAVQ